MPAFPLHVQVPLLEMTAFFHRVPSIISRIDVFAPCHIPKGMTWEGRFGKSYMRSKRIQSLKLRRSNTNRRRCNTGRFPTHATSLQVATRLEKPLPLFPRGKEAKHPLTETATPRSNFPRFASTVQRRPRCTLLGVQSGHSDPSRS